MRFWQNWCSKVALPEDISGQTWTRDHAVSLHTTEDRTTAALHSSSAQTLSHQQVCFFLTQTLECGHMITCHVGLFDCNGSVRWRTIDTLNLIPLSASFLEIHSTSFSLLSQLFWSSRRSKYDILMEHVSNFLQRSPGQVTSIITLKAQLVILSFDVWCSVCPSLRFQ